MADCRFLVLLLLLVAAKFCANARAATEGVTFTTFRGPAHEEPASVYQGIVNALDSTKRDAVSSATLAASGERMMDLDIKLTPDQAEALSGSTSGRKAFQTDHFRTWPNGVVPYEVDPDAKFTSRDTTVLEDAIAEWTRMTCLNIRPATADDEHKIFIVNSGGCWSSVGYIATEKQSLSLAWGCRYKPIIIHEFGHALGLWHEHSRPDRDSKIFVNTSNLSDEAGGNLGKLDESWVLTLEKLGIPYNIASIMHYDGTAFSKDGSRTIVAKDPYEDYLLSLGLKKPLPFSDIKAINLIYHCGSHCEDVPCDSSCFVDKNCRCVCPSEFPCLPKPGA